MTRKEFEALVFDTYNVRADYPFEEDFETGVFRRENGKWFALSECDDDTISRLLGISYDLTRGKIKRK